LDASSGHFLALSAEDRFPMCSTFKAMAVAAVLKRVDQGRETLDRFVPYTEADLLSYAPVTKAHVKNGGMPLVDLCAAAVELSDNTAANLILRSIGGPGGWTRFVRSLGDRTSRLDRTEPTLNTALPRDPRDTTTPFAMAGNLKAVLLGNALSQGSRELLTRWMVECKTGLTRLRAGLPPTWRVADKTGSGDHGTSNDIAVAWNPLSALIITCYLTGGEPAKAEARDALLKWVAEMAAEAFPGG
jgi:beta-lactamase class A